VDCKKLPYITLVCSGMEYASIIWDPQSLILSVTPKIWTEYNILQPDGSFLRTLRRPVLRAFSSDCSLNQWNSIDKYRGWSSRTRPIDDVAVPAASVDLIPSSRPSRGVNANSQKLVTVRSFTEDYRQSYSIKTVRDWNALPQSVVSAGSSAQFKSQLTRHISL